MKRQAAVSVALLYMAALLCGTALAGCERQAAAPPPGASSNHEAGASTKEVLSNADAAHDSDTAIQTANSQAGKNAPAAEAKPGTAPNNSPSDVKAAAPLTAKAAGKADAAPKKPVTKPKVDAKDAYQEEKPTLLGLSLQSPEGDVLAKLGDARNKFVMDDDANPVTVYEYDGFSVGFNKGSTLEFVDISSSDIDPGLHGLHLGQKAEDAIRALGKPDTNSTYVLTYKSQGTILKLDMDPKDSTIRSIKLFAAK